MGQPEVKIYSTPTCSGCDAAKEFLRQRGIPFYEYNVAKDLEAAERMIKRTGQTAVPVIEVGDAVIVGFDRRRLEKALAQDGLAA
ncbi:MAG TPA: NrdH-redoxin [Candidatus Fraserbacteria bacterium]|nr:NrdH-redoxin [Candidatus Fraserbacteria bacterium]